MSFIKQYSTHPNDDHMLVLSTADDIPVFGDDEFKGGHWESAMPQETIHFFQTTPIDALSSIIGRPIPVNENTGEAELPEAFFKVLPDESIAFIQTISRQFNQVGDWPCTFTIQRDLGLRQHFRNAFHIESKQLHIERQYRAIINVSDMNGHPEHETEWVATNGLSNSEVRAVFLAVNRHTGFTGDISDLPAHLQGRIQIAKTGDMLLLKGIGDGAGHNLIRDANIHRAPTFKNTYPAQGIKRIGLSWEREITEEIDLG